MKMDFGGNRRAAFRVDDLVGLDVRLIDEKALVRLHAGFEARRLNHALRSHIGHHRNGQSALLNRIGRRQPDIAAYLLHLEEQLARLADQTDLADADEGTDSETMSLVNLSAVGMSFESSLALQTGAYVELVIRLMPGSRIIYAIAEVVRVDRDAKERARVSVRFDRLHAEDEGMLNRHIVEVQQKELKSRRRAS